MTSFQSLADVMNDLAAFEKRSAGINEAETRLKVIDRILFDGLGWERMDANVERPVEGAASGDKALYLDYLLEHRATPYLVVEAKRKGRTFGIPKEVDRRKYSLKTLISHCGAALQEVIEQARDYAVHDGIPYAAVSNGFQWVIFRPFIAFQNWMNGTAFVFRGYDDIVSNLDKFHSALSPSAFASGDIDSVLELPRLPTPKFAKTYNDQRGRDQGIAENTFAKPFSTIFPLFFDSLTSKSDEQALRECYVSLPAQQNHAKEFASLLERSLPIYLPPETQPAVEDTKPSAALTNLITEDKPSVIILAGNVGAGKSTFVHHLLRVFLPDKTSTYWHIEDFIDDYQTLSNEIDAKAIESRVYDSLLDWVEKTWPEINPFEYDNLKKMFAKELQRLAQGPRKKEFASNSNSFVTAEADLLSELAADRGKLAIALLRHVKAVRGKPLCIAFDNVDRGSEAFQQFIYMFAHRLSREATCNVLVTMRYTVYETARQHGVLDTRNDTVFHVVAPNLQSIFSRRIKFARRFLQNKKVGGLSGSEANQVSDYLDVINALLLGERDEVRHCLESLSVGNVRQAFLFFKRFAMSGHTNVDHLIRVYNKARDTNQVATFYFSDFFKPFVLGSDHRFHRARSPLVNVFAVAEAQKESHFIKLRVLSYLWERFRKAPEGLDKGDTLLEELITSLASCAHAEPAVLGAVAELHGKELVERLSSSRKPFGRSDVVRISVAGSYYLHTLLYSEGYLYYVSQDTVIYRYDWFTKLANAHKHQEKTKNNVPAVVEQFVRYLVAEESSERARTGRPSPLRADWDRDFARDIAERVLKTGEWKDTVDRSRDNEPTRRPKPSRAKPNSAQLQLENVVLDASRFESATAVVVPLANATAFQGDTDATRILWALLLSHQSGDGPQHPTGLSDILKNFGSMDVDPQTIDKYLTSKRARLRHLIRPMNDGRYGLTTDGVQAALKHFERTS